MLKDKLVISGFSMRALDGWRPRGRAARRRECPSSRGVALERAFTEAAAPVSPHGGHGARWVAVLRPVCEHGRGSGVSLRRAADKNAQASAFGLRDAVPGGSLSKQWG